MNITRPLRPLFVLVLFVAFTGACTTARADSKSRGQSQAPVLGEAKLIVRDTPRKPAKDYSHPPLLREARAEVFKTLGETELLAYVFESADHKAGDKRPAAVFFFGGGWVGGSPEQFARHARYLASRGMVTVVFEYRVRSRHRTSPFEAVKDGKSAVRWVRANARRLGVDPDRIAASGGSAGGHVAAATATLPGLDEKGEDTSISCKPNALVLFNPVYDNGPDGYGYDRVNKRYKEISPIHNIRKGVPPTVVFLGTKDKLIPVATAEKYKKLTEQAGSRCDLHLYKGQPHGFFNRSPYYEKTVIEMDRFLASLGYLTGEPTLEEPGK